MTNDKRELESNLKHIASRIYDDFNDTWGINDNKAYWIYTCASYLDNWQGNLKTPLKAYKFCMNHLDDCPSLNEFKYYCEFINSGELSN